MVNLWGRQEHQRRDVGQGRGWCLSLVGWLCCGAGDGVVVLHEGGPSSGCAPRYLGAAGTQALLARGLPHASTGSCMLCVLAP